MKFAKNKTAAITIAIFLMVSIGASTMLIPNANAHTPAWSIPTYAYVQAAPSTIGLGQSTYIYMWLDKTMNGAAIGNDIRFHNYKITITAPDGKEETKTWDTVWDTTSNQGFSYTPTQVGTYTLNFTYPGQDYNTYSHSSTSAYVNDTYQASTASTTFTVQNEPTVSYPDSYPLPTEYWTRPIYGENPYWFTISSNWLGFASPGYGSGILMNEEAYSGDAVGPSTSHVMWTKPLQSGGVVGGNNFAISGDTYFEGSAYTYRFANPIIMDGKLFYTEPLSFKGVTQAMGGTNNYQHGPTDCVDLLTGELIWSRTDVPGLSFGYIYDTQNAGQHGVVPPMLVSSSGGFTPFGSSPVTWAFFDADTGNALFNVTNPPTATSSMGPNGEYMMYVISNAGTPTNPNYYLGEWNSSNVFFAGGAPPITGQTVDARAPASYNWNISMPSFNTMTSAPTVLAAYYGNMLICMNGTFPAGPSLNSFSTPSSTPYTYFAVNLNASKGTIGSILWRNTLDPPSGNITVTAGAANPKVGVFTEVYKETMQFVGYSMATGAKLWGPTTPQTALNYYGQPYEAYTYGVSAYGKLYSSAYGGVLYCYDMTNGDILWTYGNGGAGNSTNSGFQVPGPYPTFINAIGSGIVYTVTTEHTVTTPIYKGALARGINATDGTEVWTLSDFTASNSANAPGSIIPAAIADGYATLYNGYDNQIYSIGRGPSAITVIASPKVSTFGGSVIVEGTVTDLSTGMQQSEQAARFSNGVPVSSDASMKDWMGYVYQQKPLPTNFTGVNVDVIVLDSNGNYRNIGTATTDAKGVYSLMWTPDIEGKYTVIATFAGTNGYWPSSSETSFGIDAAAPTASPAPTQAPSMADLYFIPAIAGLFVAIIVVMALVLLGFRKRP